MYDNFGQLGSQLDNPETQSKNVNILLTRNCSNDKKKPEMHYEESLCKPASLIVSRAKIRE